MTNMEAHLPLWHRAVDGNARWEQICGVDVPDEPLPNVNDSEAFKAGIIGGALEALQGWFTETHGGGEAHGFSDPGARHA